MALAAVEDRLRQRFPGVDAAVVEAAVRLSHTELAGSMHDLVPVLVERAACDRLSYALPEPLVLPAPTSAP